MEITVRKHHIIFGAIAFIIILPFLRGTYVFFLDWIPEPNHFWLLESFYGKIVPYGGSLVLCLIDHFIPASISHELLIFLMLFLSAYSAYNLAPTKSTPARFFAALLYMLNPYTYVRILAGHWHIFFAYAILPLALKSFIDLLKEKSNKRMVEFILLLTFVGFNAHTLIIAFIAMGVIFLFWLERERSIDAIKTVATAGIFFTLLNAYWLIPLATAKDTVVSNIGSEDLAVFAPRIESFSALFTIASMHGFWRDGYVYAKDFLPFWQVLFVFILFLAVHGFISYYKDERIGIYVRSFAVIAVIGLLLAAGIQSPFSETFRWLFDHTPLIRGMRDSHKFVTLLVLVYAYLGALGVEDFYKGIKSRKERGKYIAIVVVALALITPPVYSFTFFDGFAGQIKPCDYPEDWYEVNAFLNQDEQDCSVLFFPWHLYMDFKWVANKDKRIATPAQCFFDKPVISGKNVEIGAIYRQMYSPEQLYMDSLLWKRENINKFGKSMVPLNIKYIILTKEVDYKEYFFLFNQSDLMLVRETENLFVFENLNRVSRCYQTDDPGFASGGGNIENLEPLGCTELSPVRFRVDAPGKKYIVFVSPNHNADYWRLEGEPSLTDGFYAVYPAGGGTVYYKRFDTYLIGYIISLLTLFGLVLWYRKAAG